MIVIPLHNLWIMRRYYDLEIIHKQECVIVACCTLYIAKFDQNEPKTNSQTQHNSIIFKFNGQIS